MGRLRLARVESNPMQWPIVRPATTFLPGDSAESLIRGSWKLKAYIRVEVLESPHWGIERSILQR
jgi:hypothetical protein